MVLKFSQVTTKGDYSKAPCWFKNNVFWKGMCYSWPWNSGPRLAILGSLMWCHLQWPPESVLAGLEGDLSKQAMWSTLFVNLSGPVKGLLSGQKPSTKSMTTSQRFTEDAGTWFLLLHPLANNHELHKVQPKALRKDPTRKRVSLGQEHTGDMLCASYLSLVPDTVPLRLLENLEISKKFCFAKQVPSHQSQVYANEVTAVSREFQTGVGLQWKPRHPFLVGWCCINIKYNVLGWGEAFQGMAQHADCRPFDQGVWRCRIMA